MWYALYSVERRNADCRVLCVQGQKREAAVTKMLTVLCFVFKRMSECQKQSALMIIIIIIIYILAHDKCTLLVVVLMLSVVCFVFRRKSEC